ncbi:MAG TPA: type II toxin-antitoxin system HicA family toxin [Aggregatilineaceae bacterium]|nr:type II toxin-antitoxin system HicA family toxin [Aggregatilineaceae bacterium]
MSKLPLISGRDCAKALQKIGFYEDHHTGSHIIMRRDDPITTLSVPNHKELKKGTLRAIIRQAGLTVEEFAALL